MPSGLFWIAEFMDIAPRALPLPGPPVEGAPTAVVTLTPSADAHAAANLDKTEAGPQQPKSLAASVNLEDQQPESSLAQESGAPPLNNSTEPGESAFMQNLFPYMSSKSLSRTS